jgi:HD-GYP domain-containing protein (c-di-GMP phosphodiesterase class II)
MIALKSLENFISSFAPISRINYLILDENGEMVFSTESTKLFKLSENVLQKFFNHIKDKKVFRYSDLNAYEFLCGIPIKNGNKVLGGLVAFGKNSHRFLGDKSDKNAKDYHAVEMERFLSSVTSLIEDKLIIDEEVKDMAQELNNNFEDLHLYGSISSKIKTEGFSSKLLHNLISDLMENMRVDATFTTMPERPDLNIWVTKPQVFEGVASPYKLFKKLIQLIPSDAVSLNENYFIINNSQEDPRYKDVFANPYRFLAVHVKHQFKSYGWLGLISFNQKEIFRQGELKLLVSMAEQLAGTITNKELYNDLEEFIINMVRSLVFAIEAKDIYTRGHSERVSKYSMLIGKQFDLDKNDYNALKWASILHDIGKIGIPEAILNKPDRLTHEEYEIIKQHPEKGHEILSPIKQLKFALPGIIYHHEHYDGRGYPRGLRGEDIPINARIIAVADTFDAITSNRAYRKARSPEQALKILEEVSGSQLDRRIVDTFKKVYKEDLKLLRKEKTCPTVQKIVPLSKSQTLKQTVGLS